MSAEIHAVAGDGAPRLNDMSLFRQQAYVDGAWIDAESGETIDVTNPATGEVLGTVPKLGAAETRRAIEAANRAWGPWRAKIGKEEVYLDPSDRDLGFGQLGPSLEGTQALVELRGLGKKAANQ